MKHARPSLDHILQAIAAIERFAGMDVPADIRKSAIHRQLEIIGEASTRLSPEFHQQHPEIPWRKIIATRNILIHLYEGVDPETVEKIVREELPVLRQHILAIIHSEK